MMTELRASEAGVSDFEDVKSAISVCLVCVWTGLLMGVVACDDMGCIHVVVDALSVLSFALVSDTVAV